MPHEAPSAGRLWRRLLWVRHVKVLSNRYRWETESERRPEVRGPPARLDYLVERHVPVAAVAHPRVEGQTSTGGTGRTVGQRRLRRGSFPSLVALQEAINRFVEEHNERPRPFIWTADPEAIVEKVRRGYHALASMARPGC